MAVEKERIEIYFLGGLIALFSIISYFVLSPFLYYILSGILLAYIFYPVYERVLDLLGNRVLSSALTFVLVLLLVMVPSLYMTGEVIRESQQALSSVGEGAVAYLDIQAVEDLVLEFTGEAVDIETVLKDAFLEAGQLFTRRFPGIITTILDAMIGLFITSITLYYLFKDGRKFKSGVLSLTPLDPETKDHLVKEVRRMSGALIGGHLLSAVAQGILTGLGLWAVGISNVVFWTFLAIILSVIPIIGAFLIWAPAGLYLIFISGDIVAGVGLLLHGAVIIGLADQLVRAKFVGSKGSIHPLIVTVGVIGGIPLFGVLGVFLGPLALGFLTVLLDVYREDILSG